MITWLYNEYGHIEIWEGELNPYEVKRESDLYIQNDMEVDHFFYMVGTKKDPLSTSWDIAQDLGYFD